MLLYRAVHDQAKNVAFPQIFNNRDRYSSAWPWCGRLRRRMGLCMRLAIGRFRRPWAFPLLEETPYRNKQVARLCFRSRGSLVQQRECFGCTRRAPILRERFSSDFLSGDITHRLSAIKKGRVQEVPGQSASIPFMQHSARNSRRNAGDQTRYSNNPSDADVSHCVTISSCRRRSSAAIPRSFGLALQQLSCSSLSSVSLTPDYLFARPWPC